MALTIQTVDMHSTREIARFLQVPWSIYVRPDGTRDPQWVPSFLPDQRSLLRPDKNPYHQHSRTRLFLALQDATVVGRITASVDDNFNQEIPQSLLRGYLVKGRV